MLEDDKNGSKRDATSPKEAALLALEHQPSAELLGDRLKRKGIAIKRVENGTSALDELQSGAFGVGVVETRLPGRTGLELLQEFPALCPPIVLVGLRGNDNEIVRAFEMGAADYITRPFSPQVAVARIRRCLRFGAFARSALMMVI